jgi:type IV secretion system protein TrbG
MRNSNVLATTILVIAALARPQAATADGSAPTPKESAKEADLLNQMETASTKALAEASMSFSPQPIADIPNARSSPRPADSAKREDPDDLLDRLAKEVEDLRAREAITKASVIAEQKPPQAKTLGAKTVYSYREGAVYQVYAAVDRITDIELKAGETLTNAPVAGDTVRWKIGLIKSGTGKSETTHVVIKPLDADLESNILLTTNHHTYHLKVASSTWYMPALSWNYPQEEDAELALALKHQAAAEPLQLSPESLNFDYEIEDEDYPWKPLRAFDDGAKTYFQMPKDLRVTEAPALFVIESGKPMLINYRVRGDYYIIDRLIKEAEFRVGPDDKIQVRGPTAHRSFWNRIF